MKTSQKIACVFGAGAAVLLCSAFDASAKKRNESSVNVSTSVVVQVSGNASTNVTVISDNGTVRVEAKASGNATASGHASGHASGSSSKSSSQKSGGQQVQQQGGDLFPGNGGTRRGH